MRIYDNICSVLTDNALCDDKTIREYGHCLKS